MGKYHQCVLENAQDKQHDFNRFSLHIINVTVECISACGVSVLTCSIADVAKNNVQISTKRVHLQNILSETNKGLVEETSWK